MSIQQLLERSTVDVTRKKNVDLGEDIKSQLDAEAHTTMEILLWKVKRDNCKKDIFLLCQI